ncbi:hypothetical protein NP233_g4503 [Leucocoprinus birnbaumii]|uniref:Uncharacterized protein n=1 Tax=Leucocoprinus birnbaumii TaxID=56174 RepID=A0AAD5YX68_9AGAR|nr:hypothetical protein NP233_g4503 [Leucocoprinus birnbaumii]
MPVKRSRPAKELARTVHHPYKLRSLTNCNLEHLARDRQAENLKHRKASREQALQILDRKELRRFPVEQLRRLAAIKRINGRRKQSIMFSLKRIYGDGVPLYPSEGRLEMKEHSREEYQVGERRVIKVDTYEEIVVKQEELDDTPISWDTPSLRRSSRLKEKPMSTVDRLPVKPLSNPRSKRS